MVGRYLTAISAQLRLQLYVQNESIVDITENVKTDIMLSERNNVRTILVAERNKGHSKNTTQ